MKSLALVASLALLCVAPAPPARGGTLHLPVGDPARKDREVAVVLDGITDAARGDTIGPAELAARLDSVKLVFVGESHTDIEFHRVQLRVIQELQRRGRQVLVGLEMYPVTEQASLDRWNSKKGLSEESFLADSHWYRNWGYHWNYYRDIFLFARNSGIPMYAVNLPRSAVQTIRMKGFDALPPEQRAMLPPKVDIENAEHQQLFHASFDTTDTMHGNMPEPVFQSMYRAQCAWDAAMGWNALQALKRNGNSKAIMVVLIGSGHVAYGLGAERQVRTWFDGRTASVIPVPIAEKDPTAPIGKVQASYANFVWGLAPETDPVYPSVGIATPEQKSGEHYKVIMVSEESPAEAAGFKVGDELVSIDGVVIADKETTNRAMSEKRWGDTVVYKVIRDGAEHTLTVFLRRRPPASPAAGTPAATPGMPPQPHEEGAR